METNKLFVFYNAIIKVMCPVENYCYQTLDVFSIVIKNLVCSEFYFENSSSKVESFNSSGNEKKIGASLYLSTLATFIMRIQF